MALNAAHERGLAHRDILRRPERIKGDRVDAHTDVYALACVLVQALTGRVPYDRDNGPAHPKSGPRVD